MSDDRTPLQPTSIAEDCARIAESHVGAANDPNYDEACRDIAKAIRDAVPSTGPQEVGVTDAMCAAAIAAYSPDRIQGFSYARRHVIRDVSMPYDQQEIWSAPVAGPEEYEAFRNQLQLERMRLALDAALSLSRPERGGNNGA